MSGEPSSGETQLEYLHRVIAHQLDRSDKSASWYRARHVRTQVCTILLSGAVTVLAGTHDWLGNQESTRSVIVALGALSAGLGTWSAVYAAKDSWHMNQSVYNRMRALQTHLEFQERSPTFDANDQEMLKTVLKEYQSILDQGNSEWQHLRQKQN